MDESKVRQLTAKIQALREERDGYKREAKRIQEEIDAIDLLRDQAIMSKSDQTRLDLVPPDTDKGERG